MTIYSVAQMNLLSSVEKTGMFIYVTCIKYANSCSRIVVIFVDAIFNGTSFESITWHTNAEYSVYEDILYRRH